MEMNTMESQENGVAEKSRKTKRKEKKEGIVTRRDSDSRTRHSSSTRQSAETA